MGNISSLFTEFFNQYNFMLDNITGIMPSYISIIIQVLLNVFVTWALIKIAITVLKAIFA